MIALNFSGRREIDRRAGVCTATASSRAALCQGICWLYPEHEFPRWLGSRYGLTTKDTNDSAEINSAFDTELQESASPVDQNAQEYRRVLKLTSWFGVYALDQDFPIGHTEVGSACGAREKDELGSPELWPTVRAMGAAALGRAPLLAP